MNVVVVLTENFVLFMCYGGVRLLGFLGDKNFRFCSSGL
jgi:hypothetical protein